MRNNIRILFTLIFIICLSGTGLLYAQTDTADRTPELIPYRKGDKWGYADKNKKIVIPVKYDYAGVFRNGRAMVRLNKMEGYLDKKGNEIIGIKYTLAMEFDPVGLASVQFNGKYGYIDTNGNAVTLFKYDNCYSFFRNNWAQVRIDKMQGLVSKDGKEIMSDSNFTVGMDVYEGMIITCSNGKCGFIDTSFKVIVPMKYDRCEHFSDGLAGVYAYGKWGFIDKSGNEVIAPKYDDIKRNFYKGIAAVELDGKIGFIDSIGNEITPFKYDYVDNSGFREGFSWVSKDYKNGAINREGKEVVPLMYDEPVNFHDGLARVATIDYETVGWYRKYGYCDTTGKVVVRIIYYETDYYSEGLINVRIGQIGKCGYLDKDGKTVIPFKYDYALPFREGIAKVKIGEKYGYIDKKGNEVIPVKYDSFGDWELYYGLRAVEERIEHGYKFKGFVDFRGNEYWED